MTKYMWPTYADILSIDHEVVNQGRSGSGNELIFYKILKDFKENKLADADLIIVQWSGENRFDYLDRDGKWIGDGNILLPKNKDIFKSIKKWYNEDYEKEKTQNYHIAVTHLLSSLDAKVTFLAFPHISADNIFLNNLWQKYRGNYQFKNTDWNIDEHPTVMQHLSIAQKILARYNLGVSDLTLQKCNNCHNSILQDQQFTFVSLL